MDNPIDSTTNESDYSLFTIRQAAHACNLSRSSLIRLEERGDAHAGPHQCGQQVPLL